MDKTFYVRAQSEGRGVTVAYLVESEAGEKAKDKLRTYLKANRIPYRVLKRVRLATEADIALFRTHSKSSI